MSETPTIKALTDAVGISPSYASMILSGARPPSRPLAIAIYRATDWRHPLIADLTDEQIDVLESVEPFAPTPRENAA